MKMPAIFSVLFLIHALHGVAYSDDQGQYQHTMNFNGQEMSNIQWNPGMGAHEHENEQFYDVPGYDGQVHHQTKISHDGGYNMNHESNVHIPGGMSGLPIQHQQNWNINPGGMQTTENLNIPANGQPGMEMQPFQNFGNGGGAAMPQGMPMIQRQSNFNYGNGGIQHSSSTNFYPHGNHQQPYYVTMPDEQPAPPQADPPPPLIEEIVDDGNGIEPWDKQILLHQMTHAYTKTCKKSDVLTMPLDTQKALVALSKKQHIDLGQFEWVVDVDKVCDFTNLARDIMNQQNDCFNMEEEGRDPHQYPQLPAGFQEALKRHHIPVNLKHGSFHWRYMACELMRKFEAEQLKDTRHLDDAEFRGALVNVILDEDKGRRGAFPETGPWKINFHAAHNAGFFFWHFAKFLAEFHLKHSQGVDMCTVLHGSNDYYDYFHSMTNGMNPQFDQALHDLKTKVMSKIPLTESPAPRSDENCTYNMFLFRPVLELYHALAEAIMDSETGWFRKHGHAYSYFCDRPGCHPEQLFTRMNGYRKMVKDNIDALRAWFVARGHGKIDVDFIEYENNVAGKFIMIIPDPPLAPRMKNKSSYTLPDGTVIKNKESYDPITRTYRQMSKYHHGGAGGSMYKSKSQYQYNPYHGGPNHPVMSSHHSSAAVSPYIHSQHNTNMGPWGVNSNHNINYAHGGGGGAPPMMPSGHGGAMIPHGGGHGFSFEDNMMMSPHPSPPHGGHPNPMGGGGGFGGPMTPNSISSKTSIKPHHYGGMQMATQKKVRFSEMPPMSMSPMAAAAA